MSLLASNPGLRTRVFSLSESYNGSSTDKSGISKAEGVELIKISQREIKAAISIISGGNSDKENAEGSSVNTPTRDPMTPVKSCATPMARSTPGTPATAMKTPTRSQTAALPPSASADALSHLHSACTSLRCVVLTSPSLSKTYNSSNPLGLEKICYHVISAAVDLLSRSSGSVATDAAKCGMAAYEVMGVLVKNYVDDYSIEDDENIVSLPSLTSKPTPRSPLLYSIPTPNPTYTSGSNDFDRQLTKIIAGVSINASRCASEVSLPTVSPSTSSSSSSPLNFGQKFDAAFSLLQSDPFGGGSILYSTALPYIQIMRGLKMEKEGDNYREKGHKFLWSFASRVDKAYAAKCQSSKTARISLEMVCLELRRQACLLLLASPLPVPSTSSPPVPGPHLEAAASAALRACGNYTQRCAAVSATHISSPSSFLPSFHSTISPLLTTNIVKSKKLPPSFSEYSAWHISTSPESISNILPVLKSDTPSSTSLKILATILNLLSDSKSESYNQIKDSIETLQKSVKAADKKVVARCFRILNVSKLPSLVSNLLNSPPAGIDSLSLILSTCIAPLSTSSTPQQAVDCFVKSSVLLDLTPSTANQALASACLLKGYKISRASENPNVTLSAAKSLATVGRRRYDSQSYLDAVTPIIMSIKCFTLCGSSSKGLDGDTDVHQLSLRYGLLGMCLTKLGLTKLSLQCYIQATRVSLGCVNIESYINDSILESGRGGVSVAAGSVKSMLGCWSDNLNGKSKGSSDCSIIGKEACELLADDNFIINCDGENDHDNSTFVGFIQHHLTTTPEVLTAVLCDAIKICGSTNSNSGVVSNIIDGVRRFVGSGDDSELLLRMTLLRISASVDNDSNLNYYAEAKNILNSTVKAGNTAEHVFACNVLCSDMSIHHHMPSKTSKTHLSDCRRLLNKVSSAKNKFVLCMRLRSEYMFLRDIVKTVECDSLLETLSTHASVNECVDEWSTNCWERVEFSDLTNSLITDLRKGEDTYSQIEAAVATLKQQKPKTYALTLAMVDLAEAAERHGKYVTVKDILREVIDISKENIRNNGGKEWLGILAESLGELGRVWGLLGDKRRAEGYFTASLESLAFREKNVGEDDYDSDATSMSIEPTFRALHNCLYSVKTKADNCKLFSLPSEKSSVTASDDIKDVGSDIEYNVIAINKLLMNGDMLRRRSKGANNGFMKEYEMAEKVLDVIRSKAYGSKLTESNPNPEERLLKLKSKVDVRVARGREILEGWGAKVEESYLSVANSKVSEGISRTYACYRLGRNRLKTAKSNGELEKLWESGNTTYCEDARELFKRATERCGPGTTSLSRRVLRCLILTSGPSRPLNGVVSLHRTIGVASRININHNVDSESFSVLDDERLSDEERGRKVVEIAEVMEEGWNVVGLGICPGGELLIGGLRKSSDGVTPTIKCILDKSTFLSSSLAKLDALLEDSRRQLEGVDVDKAKAFGEKEKREWWKRRESTDKGLKELMEEIEGAFGEEIANLLGDEQTSAANLCSKFEEACVVDLTLDSDSDCDDAPSLTQAEVKKMTVAMLKKEILERDEEKNIKGLKKAGLQECLLDMVKGEKKRLSAVAPAPKPKAQKKSSSSGGTLILVLDERLHRFPWEAMPILETESVCRVPSLPFIFAPLIERGGRLPSVRPDKCFYILDPEANLPTTSKTLKPVLDSLSRQKGYGWKNNHCGSLPPIETLDRLKEEDGLLIYCGHGGAECCFPRAEVEDRLMNKERACKSSLLLFGCSSGRLSAGGGATQGLGPAFKTLEYEPEGVVTSYLSSGAPCVVGNLWDVSDRDIDRFSIEFLDKFLSDEDSDMAKCISESRKVCKMRYIVGAAVVVYGVPIKKGNK
ncbi:hypothetical protein TrST_g6813 [Triparma strigata]|uniref:separase n=1 Tax=Triparma strigata TaxID=1606541 RepID=A0A9W7AH62_9STRA|nr:hypothetical protein TrST_g6813 [Triparma strigata]